MKSYSAWSHAALAIVATLALVGCEEGPPAQAPAVNAPPTGQAAPPLSAPPLPAAPPAAAPAPATTVERAGDPGALPAATELQKAAPGVGKKGSGYGGDVLTESFHEYWANQQGITFNISIPSAMNLFKAEHNRNPKDMDEFKKAILEPAGIKLPDLPEGARYVYDAKSGELMVERKLPSGATPPPAGK